MSELVPPELAKACAEVRLAGPGDAIGGQPARFAAEPASTAEAAALLQAAAALGLTVVPRGSGRRIGWGVPPHSCDLVVSTRRLDRVIEHAAGDLVVSVQAGVALDQLQARLAAAGQRLALDPPGGGTAGGVIATGAAGPLRLRYGTPRDLLIGITVVRADGVIAKAGGKVVKNVAGYDMGKLFAGSYGTLGLITEATFRLHPCPAAAAWVTVDRPDPAAAAAAVQAAAASPLAPSAIELHWPAAASPVSVAVLLEGDEAGVAERAGRLRDTLPGAPAAAEETGTDGTSAASTGARGIEAGSDARPRWWGQAGDAEQTVLQIAFWAARLEHVLTAIRSAASAADLDPEIGGSAAAGVLQVRLESRVPANMAAQFVASMRAGLARPAGGARPDAAVSVVVLDAPRPVRAAVDMWGPVAGAGLMRAIKDQFDPEQRMAPGRFAGGI
jgi:glycolate oxidase FAD binding subunit